MASFVSIPQVNLRIEKQNKIMSLQSKLIMASSGDSHYDADSLRRDLDILLNE